MCTYTDFPPIYSWSTQRFVHKQSLIYDVERAVEMVHENPQHYQFGMVHSSSLRNLLEGRDNYNEDRILTMIWEDAIRPILVVTDPTDGARMIDGYHRASRCFREGLNEVAAWIFSIEQTNCIVQPFD